MSMSAGDTLPYIGSPTENLTLSNPLCNNDSCKTFYLGHQESQAQVPWANQFYYGHYTAWFYIACIGMAALFYLGQEIRDDSVAGEPQSPRSSRGMKVIDKIVAEWRLISYRRVTGWMSDRFGLPPFGILLFFLLVVLCLSLLTFAARPYYRLRRGFGSPPLAVRTGLMALSLTPLIFALAGKANCVTLLTGIGHERLNVFHRWISCICFALSIVHTVPFIVQPLQEGGAAALRVAFYEPGSFLYTGVPPLAMLFGLLVLSLPWIRNRVYQAFYGAHILLALAYLALMFWHCGDEGDSWVYLWVTVFVFVGSVVSRVLWFHQATNVIADRWFTGPLVIARPLTNEMTNLEIVPPAGFNWLPGQHVFLRIPQVDPLANHPFTIASASNTHLTSNPKSGEAFSYARQSSLRFYIKSKKGFTKRLRQYIDRNPDSQLEAWIDGPYGGIRADVGLRYDNVILVAGGSGISVCLPMLEQFAHRMHMKQKALCTSLVRLVWSIRHESALAWIADAVNHLNLKSLSHQIELHVHITGTGASDTSNKSVGSSSPKCSSSKEDLKLSEELLECSKSNDIATNVTVVNSITSKSIIEVASIRKGRIDMHSVLQDLPRESHTLVIGCGPSSFNVDLSNACADLQSDVLRGKLGSLSLHSEAFEW